jgi:prepilin-type N-terminal cleavage/methylation domain-containing protein
MLSLRDRLDREDGVTLVELLVTMAVMAIVVTAVMSIWLRGQTETQTVFNRRNDLNDMRFAMQLMTKELRQADHVYSNTPSTIDVDTYINGVKHRVAFSASGTRLTRQVDSGTLDTLVTNLSNTSLFTYDPVGGTLHQITILMEVNTSSKEGTLNIQSEVVTRNL